MSERSTLFRRLAAQREVGVLFLLILTVVVATGVNHEFLGIQNIRDMSFNASAAIIVGCGMTLIIVTGEIDISVGSLMGLCAPCWDCLLLRDSPTNGPSGRACLW